MALFRESDRRVFQRKQSERNPLVWCVDDSIEIEEAYTYQVKIDQLRDRLRRFKSEVQHLEVFQ
jgi:hypothetical protein